MSMQTGRRILVTTSHRPSQRVRSFVKDLASVLPNAVRRNRGKATMRDLYYDAVSIGANRVVIVGGWKGNPGSLTVYKPSEPPEEGLELLARITLQGVRLSRETPGAQRAYGARSLGVYVEGSSDEYSMIGDLLIRLFNGRLILDLETAHKVVDVVAVVRPGPPGSVAEISFLCTGSGRYCGPTLRVRGVYDYVSGFRLYRGGVVEREAGGGSG